MNKNLAGKHQRDNQETRLHTIGVFIGILKAVSDASDPQSAAAYMKDLRGISIINNQDVTPLMGDPFDTTQHREP